MVVEKTLQSLATFFSLCCAAFSSARIGLVWSEVPKEDTDAREYLSYTFVDFCPWLAWICAFLAFTGHSDAKAGSAGGVALFLGVWLGLHGSLAVQRELGEAISESADCHDWCTGHIALIMELCAVVFGSVGCFVAIAALAATFSVAKSVVGIA